MLSLNNLSCKRGNKILFKNLSYTIGDCCILIIRGANGIGKTSLLNMIACLLEPYEGEILYANEIVTGEYFEEYCDIIQYISHKSAMKTSLTVEENLKFWASVRDTKSVVEAAINYFELDEYRDIEFGRLSQGWQKRVSLARLMLCQSEIWLLDEPYTNLDSNARHRLDELIKARSQQGGSIIMTTHEDVKFDDFNEINIEDWV